jgi:hypothetical protein
MNGTCCQLPPEAVMKMNHAGLIVMIEVTAMVVVIAMEIVREAIVTVGIVTVNVMIEVTAMAVVIAMVTVKGVTAMEEIVTVKGLDTAKGVTVNPENQDHPVAATYSNKKISLLLEAPKKKGLPPNKDPHNHPLPHQQLHPLHPLLAQPHPNPHQSPSQTPLVVLVHEKRFCDKEEIKHQKKKRGKRLQHLLRVKLPKEWLAWIYLRKNVRPRKPVPQHQRRGKKNQLQKKKSGAMK